MAALINLMKNPAKVVYIFDRLKLSRWISDKAYLKLKYRAATGKRLNLENPETYNEKLQWLKLYDRNPKYTQLVDKYEVKSIVAEKIGEEYIVPTLGVWDRVEDIDFETLPDQFVLKCTHDSGGLVICKDKSTLNIEAAKKKLSKALRTDFYAWGREWPYKNVPRRIIAEKYMEDVGKKELTDYKVHNFGGEPKFTLVCQNRFGESDTIEDYFTQNWERIDVKWPDYPTSERMDQPKEMPEILRLSKILSEGMPFVRTDFYIVDGKVYFGELTFYPTSGFDSFCPDEWDYIFGSWLQLPQK